MRVALVSGDGLPVSGLLTVFRSVVQLGLAAGLIETPVVADLGYSWRPDKPGFYPAGPPRATYPKWLLPSLALPAGGAELADEWLSLRAAVTATTAGVSGGIHLRERLEHLAGPYEQYFNSWFEENDIDWVFAVNMTLSDAVPVSLALHRAAERRWGSGRGGGILFWDHDLFGSYAVHDRSLRVYPTRPTELTPLPGSRPGQAWVVVSQRLLDEACTYPVEIRPQLVANPLPIIPTGPPTSPQQAFLEERGIVMDRPILLVPVRVFLVKGIELSLRFFFALHRLREAAGQTPPQLLVFGSLREDPTYAEEMLALAAANTAGLDVHFLDGVPLSTHQDAAGRWALDEVDLLHLAQRSGGAVLFTPNRPDVESVGLGPALAAVAGVPCAVTNFLAFHDVYGPEFACVRFDADTDDLTEAAVELDAWLVDQARSGADTAGALAKNRDLVRSRFPDGPWQGLLESLAGQVERWPTGSRPVNVG